MATKITMTLDTSDTLTTQECDDLQLLLCDAFSEFAARRHPAETYVDERYPVSEAYNGLDRPEKIAQVQRRIALAQKLHKATFTHVIDPEPRAEKRAYDEQRSLRTHTNHGMCETPCGSDCMRSGVSEETLTAMAECGNRAQAHVLLLQVLFGMEEEEARATFNRLEDKRIAMLMVEQGLVKS